MNNKILMQKKIDFTNPDVIKIMEEYVMLLAEITDLYEKKISDLESENKALTDVCKQNIIWKIKYKGKSLMKKGVKCICRKGISSITRLGLKESCKETKIYHKLKEKRFFDRLR